MPRYKDFNILSVIDMEFSHAAHAHVLSIRYVTPEGVIRFGVATVPSKGPSTVVTIGANRKIVFIGTNVMVKQLLRAIDIFEHADGFEIGDYNPYTLEGEDPSLMDL